MSNLIADWRDRPTHRRVWALAAPMILSNISVPLVALVDSTVIGHLPHAHQLGAVAVGASLYTFLAWAMGFLRMGTTGFAAQAAGRSDGAALRQILLQGLLLAMGLALLLGTLGVPLSGVALHFMQPSAELDQLTRDFFHTRLFGLPAALASYALVGWFLGTQNARAPLAILLSTEARAEPTTPQSRPMTNQRLRTMLIRLVVSRIASGARAFWVPRNQPTSA